MGTPNIDDMNIMLLNAKTVASSGVSLAAQTKQIIVDIETVLGKLAVIQSNDELAGTLRAVIGLDGLVYVNSLAVIFQEALVKVNALETGE